VLVTRLHEIQETVQRRVDKITSAHADWPCRKGCDDCCRQMASPPRVSREEWRLIDTALDRLPAEVAEAALRRIRESASATRPVVCPLLDTESGACLVYAARPVACRAYGFYAERQYVLGCNRIRSIGDGSPEVVWGNHAALEDELRVVGDTAELAVHIGADDPDAEYGRSRPAVGGFEPHGDLLLTSD